MAVTEITENGVTFNCSDATTGVVLVYNTTDDWGRTQEADGSKIQSQDEIEEFATQELADARIVELGITDIT